MTDKMRKEFERTNGRDHRRSPPKGNNYIDPMAQADWESFQKGWNQCLASVEIDLPEAFDKHDSGDWMYWADQVDKAIADAGLKVKP